MVSSTLSAALDRFCDPDGVCSAAVAAEAGVVLKPSALACTVASTGRKIAVSSTREQYGHLVTLTVAKLQSDISKSSYPYFGHPAQDQGINHRNERMTKWNPTSPTKEVIWSVWKVFDPTPWWVFSSSLLVIGTRQNRLLGFQS
jgi:hypothetical protein